MFSLALFQLNVLQNEIKSTKLIIATRNVCISRNNKDKIETQDDKEIENNGEIMD